MLGDLRSSAGSSGPAQHPGCMPCAVSSHLSPLNHARSIWANNDSSMAGQSNMARTLLYGNCCSLHGLPCLLSSAPRRTVSTAVPRADAALAAVAVVAVVAAVALAALLGLARSSIVALHAARTDSQNRPINHYRIMGKTRTEVCKR